MYQRLLLSYLLLHWSCHACGMVGNLSWQPFSEIICFTTEPVPVMYSYIVFLCRYQDALTDFDDAMRNLRGNLLIDYKQLGLMYKFHACEVSTAMKDAVLANTFVCLSKIFHNWSVWVANRKALFCTYLCGQYVNGHLVYCHYHNNVCVCFLLSRSCTTKRMLTVSWAWERRQPESLRELWRKPPRAQSHGTKSFCLLLKKWRYNCNSYRPNTLYNLKWFSC